MARHPVSGGWGGWTGFALGVGASVLIETAGPQVAKAAERSARSVLKFGFAISDRLARSAARTREQVEDFVATTRAEYDAEQETREAGGGHGAPEQNV